MPQKAFLGRNAAEQVMNAKLTLIAGALHVQSLHLRIGQKLLDAILIASIVQGRIQSGRHAVLIVLGQQDGGRLAQIIGERIVIDDGHVLVVHRRRCCRDVGAFQRIAHVDGLKCWGQGGPLLLLLFFFSPDRSKMLCDTREANDPHLWTVEIVLVQCVQFSQQQKLFHSVFHKTAYIFLM